MMISTRRLRDPSDLLYFVEREGDPYPLCVVAEWHDETTVEIKGVDKPMTLGQAREIREWAKQQGAKTVLKERKGRLLKLDLTRR